MHAIFEPVEKQETLSKKVAGQIEDNIRSKILIPGDKLPNELDMSALFGVSRPVVREALQILNGKGVINILKGSGIFVNSYSDALAFNPMHLYLDIHLGKDLIIDIAKLRCILEPQSAKLAALNRTTEDIDKLTDILTKFSSPSMNNPAAQSDLDLDFHLKLAESTNSLVLPMVMGPIFQMMPKITEIIRKVDHAHEIAVDYHQNIYEMIVAGDGDGAFNIMLDHMNTAYEHSLIAVKKMD
ncbi:MAG: FadR family transcriptional regulator [Bacteroidetes bacterium]|jgi:GntR family transcriptional regulator, transcriptional repressor for pyruvate dehydrogenase complex|nr:FadR family transcriptional regulator [Bacteroidota bacterium]